MDESRKTILIIGATGGIGEAISQALASAETKLILTGTNTSKLKNLQETLTDRTGEISIYDLDLTASEELTNFCKDIAAHDIHIDWIIHAAGYIDTHEPTGEASWDKVHKTFTINSHSPIYLTQSLQEHIKENGGVIFLSSTASLWGNPQFPVYAASKAALNTFSLALAKQFSENSLTSLVICPGPTNTLMRGRIANDADLQQSPDVIATYVYEAIYKKNDAANGDIIIIRDGQHKKHVL